MSFKDILLMGLKNLLRRKTRSILAIVGVIIGTAAITVMLSLGIGLSESFESQVKEWGNLHIIQVYPGYEPPQPGRPSKELKITDKTIKDIKKIPNITAITPEVTTYVKVAVGKFITTAELIGIETDVLEKFNPKLKDGRFVNKSDKMGILFGKNVAMGLYNPSAPPDYSRIYEEPSVEGEEVERPLPVNVINAKVKFTHDFSYGERNRGHIEKDKKPDGTPVEHTLFEGKSVGVMDAESDSYSYAIIMNIEDVKKIKEQNQRDTGATVKKTSNYEYENAKIYVEDTKAVKGVAKTLKDKGYRIMSLIDMLEEVKQISTVIQAVLGGLGAVSLIVAALGITNTMVMSIYERTKEIGIMKVIGANIKDIRKLFLIEAAAIGFFGGIAGIIISYILSFLTNAVLGNTLLSSLGVYSDSTRISIIPWYLAVASLIFATSVGIVAGYIPANRAMKLSALESLRNE